MSHSDTLKLTVKDWLIVPEIVLKSNLVMWPPSLTLPLESEPDETDRCNNPLVGKQRDRFRSN